MDHFGIGTAMRAMAQLYQQTARRTGRTTSLLNSVKDGDRIVFASVKDARLFGHLLRERGKKVECVVRSPDNPDDLFHLSMTGGRTLFDHRWVEDYYALAIDRSYKEIDNLQGALSKVDPLYAKPVYTGSPAE
jgi:hypothetical protein